MRHFIIPLILLCGCGRTSLNEWEADFKANEALPTMTGNGEIPQPIDPTPTVAPAPSPTPVPIRSEDDPYWPNVSYTTPEIVERVGSDSFIYRLSATRVRSNGHITYWINFTDVYTAKEGRFWTQIRLPGGYSLPTNRVEYKVLQCWGMLNTCVFNEVIAGELPRSALAGDLRLMAYTNGGAVQQQIVIPVDFVTALVTTVEGKIEAKSHRKR